MTCLCVGHVECVSACFSMLYLSVQVLERFSCSELHTEHLYSDHDRLTDWSSVFIGIMHQVYSDMAGKTG